VQVRVTATKRQGDFLLNADFTITGERIEIFGKSGSGKSTLVALLAGLQQPDTGEISLDGECLFSHAGKINIPVEQRRIAIVFQHSCLFPHLSVKANLLFGYRRCAPEHRRINPDTLIEALEIGDLLKRGVNNLSGGEKQRIALGRAILANPRLLLMDEPLSALDDTLRFQIIPYLKNVSDQFGIPYMFISHSMVEMRLMAEQVLVADGGTINEVTTAEQLARDRMGKSTVGYINLLKLTSPRSIHGLYSYRWGEGDLLISNGGNQSEALFELSSKDIILFKRHPEAISARNLLKSTVLNTFASGNRVGIELLSGGERLIAEVVSNAVEELGIKVGCELYAAVKASAFRRLR
jgi:molybdate transport system ATP-binding protein